MVFTNAGFFQPTHKSKAAGDKRSAASRIYPTQLLRGFEQSLLGFFLALDAMPRPRHSLQTLGINFFAAGDAFPKTAFADARQSTVHHIEQLAVVITLAEKKFLVVGAGSAVGDVLSGLIVGGATVLLITDNHLAQFIAPGFEFL